MKQIRTSKFSKLIAYYLAIMMFLQVTQPVRMYALTSGPTQPEFNAFTPIGTSDMVDLASGDFNYNIPIMDVGGYPINLAYNSGVSMDQEASWVGLGWNLNVGQIERQVRGLPDDFKGEEVKYYNNLKPNRTVGFTFRVNGQLVGFESGGGLSGNAALTLQHNNYNGISAVPSFGFAVDINRSVSVGMNISSSATEGVSVAPSVNVSMTKKLNNDTYDLGLSAGLGLSFNSRQGLQSFSLYGSTSIKRDFNSKSDGKGANSRSIGLTSGAATFNFINNSFTPVIRNEFSTYSGTFSTSFGGHAYLFDGEVGVVGFFSNMKLKSKITKEKAYGYEFTHLASENDLLDFNRENDRGVTKNTRVLPVTNYTYDTYSMQTQGMSGSFRPYQSQVGYVFDAKKRDDSKSGSLGVEAEIGWGMHFGMDVEDAHNDVRAGVWDNPVVNYFKKSQTETLEYENSYFKFSNDLTLNKDIDLLTYKLGETNAIDFKLLNVNNLKNEYRKKQLSGSGTDLYNYTAVNINNKIKRTVREERNQVVYKVTARESEGDVFVVKNDNAEDYHTAGFKALNNDGSTYVFGNTIYNTTKNEVTFALSKNVAPDNVGIYSPTNENDFMNQASVTNGNGIDHYFNKIVTPSYTNSYLLSAVLSNDYEDITGDGMTDDDLGSYTKFVYEDYGNYKWRAPYYGASYNPGYNADRNHKKASYTYGERESKYISRIETKTHVAIFELSPRKDGLGVESEYNLSKNINSASKMYKIDKIKLYSKPEAKAANLLNEDPSDDLDVSPIKTAHFIYNYNLCKGVDNNYQGGSLTENETSNSGGKLTLEKVYFTYRDSNMGKYTPYVFNYDEDNPDSNPDYNMKSFDVWGNYKENNGTGAMLPNDPISSVEFPYVEQEQNQADSNTSTWSLRKIQLPSGGEINIETESDDYQYVQDKRAMQMFKVVGVSKIGSPSNFNSTLFNANFYGANSEAKYVVVEVDDDYSGNPSLFMDKYIGDQLNKPIFFRFMLNMAGGSNDYDYVEGYFKLDKNSQPELFSSNGKYYAALPMEWTDMEGGTNGNKDVNPISKAGWYFGRQNMNKTVYGLNNDPDEENIFDIINAIGSSFQTMTEIFSGPNGKLRNEESCARYFKPEKSWIRLLNPTRKKLGGGCRVKSVTLSDKWTNMLNGDISDTSGTDLNDMQYGQLYDYTLENGTSSGVATFEPLGAKDNPFVVPFYDKGVRLIAPKETNYSEKPFGVSFFPAPTVTYSRVTVRNLPRANGDKIVKKHATGYVSNYFYTSKDFPTKTDFTEIKNGDNLIDSNPDPMANFLAGILGLPIIDETKLTATQGFSVETNDMNGKQKKQEVFDENDNLISQVKYEYSLEAGELNNTVPVINSKGEVQESAIGIDYDVINDFRTNTSSTRITGFKGNLSIDIWVPCPTCVITYIWTTIPSYEQHDNILRMATTTKVIHRKGIMKETIATDLGSTVATKNLLWDASSGQVLLTETVNEYDDHYYSFSYPAYWMYDGMGLASNNIGIHGTLSSYSGILPPGSSSAANNPFFWVKGHSGIDLTEYFHVGDEIYTSEYVTGGDGLVPIDASSIVGSRLWVVGFSSDKKGILLMDRYGSYINQCGDYDEFDFKIVRSGYRNLQSASMASVTLMKNPLKDLDNDGEVDFDFDSLTFDGTPVGNNPYIINSSAVLYKDFWLPQYETGLYYPAYVDTSGTSGTSRPSDPDPFDPTEYWPVTEEGLPNYPYGPLANPYVFNVKGEWRAEKSYAYLTGRRFGNGTINNPRVEGFYTKFSPFYKLDANKNWVADETGWTFASSVTQYSPYGPELENKDALDRYSSAQYAYKYTLPIAVASNAKYRNMGFEGFESDNTHLDFLIAVQDITSDHSHTGKKSIKVENGGYRTLTSNLQLTPPTIEILDNCPTIPDENDPSGCSSYTVSNGRSTLTFAANSIVTIEDECGITEASASVNGNVLNVSTYICGAGGAYYLKISVDGEIMYLYFSYAGCGIDNPPCDDDGVQLITVSCIHGRNCSSTPFEESCFN
ncbi:hypothetical protein NHF50_09970 [Flavobacterium sp. NRK F10]|uniref:hypothetical protein n=1 Tax=Flavobacterium sp. NRK F10 TaxID=2954931 RepID=UPI00209001FC|nr:hypothetical protein [Flavobacterium sp. NRK F10]MCO6175369.1 hypothetical protein [Flavobacterium sp. NRK F10]